MPRNNLTVSVVIPVYNEESKIAACLDAVCKQQQKAKEIILVDNNCNDRTIAIARNYPVKIIKEPRQGLIFARNRGLNKATGDILARIDADTILPPDWIKKVVRYFNDHPEIDGVSGYGRSRTGVKSSLFSDLCSFYYFIHTKAFFGVEILWGANMAIRKSVWNELSKHLICSSKIHEDQDLSLALASVGGLAKVVPDLKVSVDFDKNRYFDTFLLYNRMKKQTKKLHLLHERSKFKNMQSIPYQNRVYYHLISDYYVIIYGTFCAISSGLRFIKKRHL